MKIRIRSIARPSDTDRGTLMSDYDNFISLNLIYKSDFLGLTLISVSQTFRAEQDHTPLILEDVPSPNLERIPVMLKYFSVPSWPGLSGHPRPAGR
jgi:hypothetical protein